MQNIFKYTLLSVCLIITLSSCKNNEPIIFIDLLKWINNNENGLIKESSVDGLKITMKYLPPQYLAYREMSSNENINNCIYDSLLNVYKWSHSFLMIVGPDEEKGEKFDVMFLNTSGKDDFTQRVYDMNFNIKDLINLKTAQRKYKPAITSLENVYSLNKSRTLYIVFTPEKENDDLLKAEKLDFIYNDEIFNTGIHHFVFNKKDIENTPNLLINK